MVGVSTDSLLGWLAAHYGWSVTSHVGAVLLLLGLRLAPMAWLAPWLAIEASVALPVALCAGLVLLLLPQALVLAPAALVLDSTLWLPAWFELARGVLLALALALPLHAFGWAGELSDQLRDPGLGAAAQSESSRSALGVLYRMAALAVFFASSGHTLVLSAIAATLREQPLGAVPAAVGPALLSAARLVVQAFDLSVVLCAPLLLCLLVAALLLGLLSRLAAPVVAQLSRGPLLPVLGLAVAMLCVSSILPQVPLALRVFVAQAQALMHAFS